MKSFFFSFSLIFFTSQALTQVESEEIICLCEIDAEFPGGMEYMQQWFDSYADYPLYSIEQGVEGRVYVDFICNEDGSISDVNIVRGISKELDSEVLYLIKSMPTWQPYQLGCSTLKIKIRVAIHFELI